MPWDQYVKVNQDKVHRFNARDNGDELIDFMGDGGTVTDGQKMGPISNYKPPNYTKKLNDAIKSIKKFKQKKTGKYPTKRDCKKFKDLFMPKCEKEEERKLYSVRKRGKRRSIRVEESHKRKAIVKRKLKSNRALMVPGAGGGGQGAEASGSPQLSDARIVIHDFAAPEQPMPNLLENQNSDRRPQLIRAIYRGPPQRLLSDQKLFI